MQMKKADLFAGILAATLTVAFIGSIVMLSWREIPKSNEQLLTYMLGQLSGFVAAAVGVYFARRPDSPPAGTHDDPLQMNVINKPEDPVPTTTDAEEKEPKP